MRLLIVEDSDSLRRSIAVGLRGSGYTVETAADGEQGLAWLKGDEFDAVVLDVMLPGISGLDLLHKIRQEKNNTPVLILSARDQVEQRIQGLNVGADDYLIKPFDFGELVARLQALIRRQSEDKNSTIDLGIVQVDRNSRSLKCRGIPVSVTPTEYRLFEYLAVHRGKVYSKKILVDRLYRNDQDVSDAIIEVMVCNLRNKLGEYNARPVLKTRRGHGYYVE